jgi:hypothetical protein
LELEYIFPKSGCWKQPRYGARRTLKFN